MQLLIGIAGRKEVGKDTVAAPIAGAFGLTRYAFAHPITSACAAALGLSHDAFLALDKDFFIKSIARTKRDFMCAMGDALIGANPYFLINNLGERITTNRAIPPNDNGHCITDVRTEREAQWVRMQGGIVIHVTNPFAAQNTQHRTEVDLAVAPGDYAISNKSSLLDLQDKIDQLITDIMQTHVEATA